MQTHLQNIGLSLDPKLTFFDQEELLHLQQALQGYKQYKTQHYAL